MRIEEHFTAASEPATVWEYFTNVREVAECMPGVQVTEVTSPTEFSLKALIKVGAISSSFEGRATMERDEQTRRGQIKARGVDKRGGSRATATIDYALSESAGSSTEVAIAADVTLAGQIAQFGRTGIMQEISSMMTAEFVKCLNSRLAAVDGTAGQASDEATARTQGERPQPPAAVRPVSLVVRAALRRAQARLRSLWHWMTKPLRDRNRQ